jgi:hypothetical protein
LTSSGGVTAGGFSGRNRSFSAKTNLDGITIVLIFSLDLSNDRRASQNHRADNSAASVIKDLGHGLFSADQKFHENK